MSFDDLLNFTISDHISLSAVLLRLTVAGFSGLLISGIYRLYHGKDSSQSDMMHSLIFLSLIICCAMMVIGNNLASAFGLVGAVSIIRFRTSVKSARDMSFVFFAVVIGMSCGLGFLILSMSGLFFTSLVMLIIYAISNKKNNAVHSVYKIKINFIGSASERDNIENILNEHSSQIFFDSLRIEEDKISFTYGIYLDHINIFDSILSSLNKNPQLIKLKIIFGNWEK